MNIWRIGMAGLLLGALLGSAAGQVFGGYQGSTLRQGRHDAGERDFNPGRGFLRWWDPLFTLTTSLDNWMTGATPNTPADWIAPNGITAFNAFQANLAVSPTPPLYRYAVPLPSLSIDEPQTPASGTAPSFEWRFTGLSAGEAYAISVNIPVGPTDVDPSAALDLRFQTRFQVYRIDGVDNPNGTTDPVIQVVDTSLNVGGWVRLGAGGAATNQLYQVSTGSNDIRVTLLATVPRNADGSLSSDPAQTIVYADGARINAPVATAGAVTNQAVVAQNATGPFPWRVVSGRTEPTIVQDGSTLKTINFPLFTSYTHSGAPVVSTDLNGRRNMVWSWPVQRPFSASDAEVQRYQSEKADWILGQGLFSGDPSRADQTISVDNTNANVRVGASWTVNATRLPFRGLDYLETPSVATSVDEVRYEPALPDGQYQIQVFIPGGTGQATGAQYEIRQAGVTVDTDTVDQAANAGRWVTLRVGSTTRWSNSSLAPLTVAVTGASNPVGGTVLADQVRFIRVADMSALATPIYTRANVRVGSTTAERDVVIVALENGRLYCLDAVGLQSSGTPNGRTRVYWTYPSETTGADPNHVAGLDGPDGLAEMPTAFGNSSPALARINIGGSDRDLVFIGSANGRVYCIDVEGRGDGTTTRRWSFPNDYPQPSVESALGPIAGSVSVSPTNSGWTVFVPTVQGRLYALDAAGDDTTKTTTTRWTFPGISDVPVGSITMAPTIGWESGNPANRIVYFGTNTGAFLGSNTLFAVRADDGNADTVGDLAWSQTQGAIPFNNFLNISPAFADAAQANQSNGVPPLNPYGPDMPNTLFVGNTNSEVSAFDATTGNLLWSTVEVGSSPSGPLTFSYMRGRQLTPPNNILANPEPIVIVPTVDGRYVSLYAQAGRNNGEGGREYWSSTMSQTGPVQPMATGGPNTPDYNYMIGSDPAGYLYAWSWDPSLPDDAQTVTPGEPPINDQPQEGGQTNLSLVLAQIADAARVDFILPGTFRDLQQRAGSGTLTEADVTAAINQVTRRNFEFGETLYLLVHNLPDPDFFSPRFPYLVDVLFNSPGTSSQRTVYGLTAVSGAPASRNRVVLASFPFLGIGQNALVPGRAELTVRIINNEAQQANRLVTAANFRPSREVFLANPLAVALIDPGATGGQQTGLSLSPADTDNIQNGTPSAKLTSLIQNFRRDLSEVADEVAHGQTGVTRMFVYDRSLMTLLFGGQRGLTSVRMQLQNLNFLGSISNALDPLVYPGLEDRPGSPGNNVSLDYPDIRRDRMIVTKSQFGTVENPLFQPVSLIPPTFTSAQQNQYSTDPAQYNQFLDRQLVGTTFDFELNVPRFQPPAGQGYRSNQFVFVDAGAPGRQLSGSQPIEPFREFGLRATVASDARVALGTPTVDLGSIPGGGGFTPEAPWNSANYTMLDPRLHNQSRFPFFQRFSVFNEGNVNLLNVRVAKQIQSPTSATIDAMAMFSPTLSPSVALDGRLTLLSDLDPFFAARAYASRPTLGNRVILQKARPDDGEPTRLRVNPRVRSNANLEVVDGDLIPVGGFPSIEEWEESKRDPKLAMAIPIGTPVGRYNQNVFVFEDLTATSNAFPILDRPGGTYEPYSDSPMSLIFSVRETRLTTNRTGKAMNMADNIALDPAGRFQWSNAQPAVARDNQGTLVVALSSDRLLNGAPSTVPGVKGELDNAGSPQWRIYFFTLSRGASVPTTVGYSMDQLFGWQPSVSTNDVTRDKWFAGAVGGFPTNNFAASVMFNIPAAQLDAASLQFGNPVFPSAGFFEPLTTWSGGLTNRGNMLMAFTGEATRVSAVGERRRESRLFITRLTTAGGGVTAAQPQPLDVAGVVPDPQARIGRPAIVQTQGRATVFYPITTAGSTAIYMSFWNGTDWTPLPFARRGGNEVVSRLRTGEAFESVTAPSAVLRAANSPAVPFVNVIELVFTGRVRGRSHNEVYLARIPADAAGRPISNESIAFTRAPNRSSLRDPLTLDAGTGLYWANGVDWVDDFSATNGVDVQRFVNVGGVQQFESILVPGTFARAEGSGIVSYDTIFGGKAFIDLGNGSVRFTGSLVPRATRLFVRYRPRLLRLSVSPDVNHRAAAIAFDFRRAGDRNYWFDASNNPITSGFEFSNRWIVSYGKTASRDSQASRPFMTTFRVGARLPRAIQLNQDGTIRNLNFTFVGGGSVPYQVDPAGGRIFFDDTAEGRAINVTYDAVDVDGQPLGTRTVENVPVELLEEQAETSIPIEQVSNESAITMALDALGGGYTNNDASGNLIWMFWASSRGGGSDVYFQTISPRFGPQRPGN